MRFFTLLENSPALLPAIEAIGISLWDPIWARYEHTSTCVEIMHIVQGAFKLRAGQETFSAKTGDTLIIPNGTAHRDDFSAGSLFKVLHIQFHWGEFESCFTLKNIVPMLTMDASAKGGIHRKAIEIYSTLSKSGRTAHSETLVRALLFSLLVYIKAAIAAPTLDENAQSHDRSVTLHSRMLRQAEDFVRNNISKHIKCSDIASHLGISTYHLSHVFSREKGFTLASFVLRCRMERASEYLRTSLLRISEVAYHVGFEDPNHFAKCFKKHFGCSPSAYREIH